MLLNKYKNQVDSAPGNHGNDGKFHKTHQILNETKSLTKYLTKASIVNAPWQFWATPWEFFLERTKCLEECSK